ncbi:MAG: DEAD/DEAH box helicase, partial [Nitratireductor sp.]|nr:DEAD/DEAH box helicase [Nitratireductor sp.]
AFLNNPVRVEAAPPGKTADRVRQAVYHVTRRGKPDLLASLLEKQPNDISIVFARTKHGAERLKRVLAERGFAAASIHGNKSQSQRDRAIKSFKAGDVNILVATDVAARGIDIPGVTHVYNFDLPEVPAQYVHRIGRTARAGEDGDAVAFCSPEEAHLLKAIEKQLGMELPVLGDMPQTGDAGSREDDTKPARRAGGERRGDGTKPDGKRRNRRRKPRNKALDGTQDPASQKPGRRRRKPESIKAEAASKQASAGSRKPEEKAEQKKDSPKKRRRKPRRWQRGRPGKSG